jgi:hypothetical protein
MRGMVHYSTPRSRCAYGGTKDAAPREDRAAFKSEQGFSVWVGGAPLSHQPVGKYGTVGLAAVMPITKFAIDMEKRPP